MKNNEDEDSQIESYLLAGSIPTGVDVGNIFKKVLQRIASADLTLSGNACKLVETSVETSAEHQNLLTIMFSESSKFATADKNVYLRYANIWARLLAKNEDLFESCRSCGAVDAIISMCRCSQDVLVQVVTMELLTEFAKTSSGLQFLFNNGTIDWLVGVPSSEDDATFLGNQALRQLGDIFLTAASKSLMTEEFWSAIDKSLIAKHLHAAQTYLENRSESDRLTGD
jgi:Proteasome non-ATPase 26S subunit